MTQIAQVGVATAPGTCGELVQGRFVDGRDFLVTLPIHRRSGAHVRLHTHPPVRVEPPGKVKTRRAVRLALDHFGCTDWGASVEIRSDLPEGKGMASSTADIVAACRATANALGREIAPDRIAAIAHAIEPSDGVMYSGCVCLDHRRGGLIADLGPLPALHILGIDLGGTVDTVVFNRQPKEYTAEEIAQLERAYRLAMQGICSGDYAQIGAAATLSARINQRLLPKAPLERLIDLAETCGACGVNVAHSGTLVGILFAPAVASGMDYAARQVTHSLGPGVTLYRLHTI